MIADSDFASTAAGIALQQGELAKQMKKAASALLTVAILQTLFGFLMYFLLRTPIEEGRINGTIFLGTLFGIAALFWGLYFWARQNPFPATVVGFIVYVTLWALDFTVGVIQMSHAQANSPTAVSSPFNGIILKAIITVILFNGVKAGSKYRQIIQQTGNS